jgi:peptide/nickel transport system substrate-binding protein
VKPKNRELLDPKVKEALEYATDRSEIVDVIYNGHAKPWANWIWRTRAGVSRPRT